MSMKAMQNPCAISASTLLIAWYLSVSDVEIPICSKIGTEKYWIADTPVIWIDACTAQARKRRRKADLRKRGKPC